jgi:acetyl-CoA carboxylase carboxyltransferase component
MVRHMTTRLDVRSPEPPPTPRLGLRRATTAPVTAEVRDLDGRQVVWVELGGETASGFRGVPLASTASAIVEQAATVARVEGLPFVFVLASTGADIVEGIAALEGWGRLAKALVDCSGIVPTMMVVDGPAVSGPALLLGVADLVVMTDASYAFVNGPVMVEEFTGVRVTTDELGGAGELARNTGVPSLVVPDREAALDAVADLLAYLPQSVDDDPPLWPSDDPPDRDCPEAGALIPPTSTGSYDVRAVASAIVDADSLLPIRDRWAPNVVTAFATIAGRPVGIVANQPLALAGTLDIPASQKAARFVAFCDAFNLPLVTLVDTPGFYPGKDLEWRGMIRHGAQLVFAYARATVPRICIILRKSYGGAYIVMDSKAMGNDACYAWPWAELAVMGAGQAAAILQRRATPEERAAFEADYAERLLNPYVAAERGFIDAVLEPAATRRELARALAMLEDKRERLQARKHGNEPC